MKKIIIYLILILISFNTNSQVQKSYISDLEKDTIKLLSWNIKMLPDIYYDKQTKQKQAKRSKKITKELLQRQYDIIILQEAFNFNSRRIIKKHLKTKYPYIYKPLNYKALSIKGNGGVWILSKIPLTKIEEIKYKSCSGTDCLARKGAVIMQGVNKKQKFQIVGTHLQSGKDWRSRKKQYEDLNFLLNKHKINNVPQIICGDMNCDSNNKQEFTSMINIIQSEDTNKKEGLNYSNYRKDKIIDYVLVRKNNHDIKINSKIILIGNDWTIKNNYKQKLSLSDHLSLESVIIF